MRQLRQNLRYSLRALRKNPGFTAVAILSLALGIGANVAIFTLVNALLLRDLPVPHPERLVELSLVRHGAKIPFSYPMFRELERGQRVFSALVGWSESTIPNVEVNGIFARSNVLVVTSNFYSELFGTSGFPLLRFFFVPFSEDWARLICPCLSRVTEADAQTVRQSLPLGRAPPSPTAARGCVPREVPVTERYKGKTRLPIGRQILAEICRCHHWRSPLSAPSAWGLPDKATPPATLSAKHNARPGVLPVSSLPHEGRIRLPFSHTATMIGLEIAWQTLAELRTSEAMNLADRANADLWCTLLQLPELIPKKDGSGRVPPP